MTVLEEGIVLEVLKEFDPALVDIGDWGVILKGTPSDRVPPTEPHDEVRGASLNIFTTRATGGALPLYNTNIEELVEEGTFRIVPDATQEDAHKHCTARRDAHYKKQQQIPRIRMGDYNFHHKKDRDRMDADLLALLNVTGALNWTQLRGYISVYSNHYTDYGRAEGQLLKSARRLELLGKILPFEEHGPFIPSA